MTHKKLEIFKPGTFTDMAGTKHNFSEADLRTMAAVYDPAKYQAPLVIGHPTVDGPSYGDVASLEFSGTLLADPANVDAAFAELVNAGRYNRISASFYSPASPNNPVPGAYYLRHVGFLGAQPPAVKGLKPACFADNEAGVISFADFGCYEDRVTVRVLRGIKNLLTARFGSAEVDQAISEYDLETLTEEALRPETPAAIDEPSTALDYGEQTTGGVMTEAELKQKEQELTARETTVLQKETADRKAANLAFAEALVKEGKLLAANLAAVVAVLNFADGLTTGDVIEFGEGDAKKSEAPAATLKVLFTGMPKVIEFGELVTGADPTKVPTAIPTDINKYV